MFKFTIPGEPKAWQRARANFKTGAFFEKPEVTSYKATAALFARDAGIPLLEGLFRLELDFYFNRPQAKCRKSDPREAIPKISRPDGDNLFKMIGDALNGIVWADDALIWNCVTRKWYHEIGGAPRTEVAIY